MSKFSYVDGVDALVIVSTHPDSMGQQFVVDKSSVNYPKVKEALKKSDTTVQEIEDLITPARAIQKQIDSEDYHGIEIIDGVLYYEEEPVIGSLATRIVRLYSEGFELEPLALFAERLWRNPDPRVRAELDLFLEACDLPITPDGFFLAYKKVRANYKDIHSGTFDNSIGTTPSMPRDKVDNDRNRTCSTGLHFCSKTYLPAFGGSSGYRVMIVKVSPEDVVAIPSDYKNAKGRACKYEVVGEIGHEAAQSRQWPAVSSEYGAPQPAKLVDTKTVAAKPATKATKLNKPTKAGGTSFNIQTKELGVLNSEHARRALAKHGNATNWARAHGWNESTVRDWIRRLRKAGATL